MNSVAVAAEDIPPWDEVTLSEDWGGERSKLFEKGISLEFTHRSDVMDNLDGGLQRGAVWMGYTDAKLLADLEKLYDWKGLKIYLQYNSALGGKHNVQNVGSSMGVDNIEVMANTAQFYQAWLQQNWLNDSLSVLLGLYPIDSEFYVTDTSGLFLHPSLGMAAEVAQSGVNGPPVYPLGAMGTRVKYTSPNRTTYLQAAFLDGVPGDPDNPYGSHFRFDRDDGSFAIVEIGYLPMEAGHTFEPVEPDVAAKMEPVIKLHEKFEVYNKTAFGMWRYTARFGDLSEVDAEGNPLLRASFGWYAVAERSLFSQADNPNLGLAAFLRFGTASADIHKSDWTASTGLRYRGLLAGRDDDLAGVAMTVSHVSPKYQSVNRSTDSEMALEATYRIQLKRWLAVQPLLQRIISPAMDPGLRDASLLGVRLEVFI